MKKIKIIIPKKGKKKNYSAAAALKASKAAS